ncbi:TetR/AcrR family transcriptional regulator [Actinoplanes friuliensis]|uniref:Putative transcriptional regulatory protein (TetR-family) n=1 Tax=Actinoplanes friuliensis DSM 7358 TaxID=1246995 RepID=U5VVT4_9ACTN|nr:TetR/AcrR family transcriptional regulator [Actinoplanes friuliensis]AGZ40984.1 putative transcriptional regulatory protein (TetR-family) [Actinoplanes friuliensis DSM 7358]
MTTRPALDVTARQRREGDQLRGELLEAAAVLAATPRPVAVPSLRAVARACGVSATAVYRHFPSQAALTHAVITVHHQAFVAAVLRADDPAGDPEVRLHRLAVGYVRWGLANPGMYQLLFESADQLDAESGLGDITDEVMKLASTLLAELTGTAPAEVAVLAERLWFGLHGIVSLRMHKPDQTWHVAADEAAVTVAQQILA